MLKLLPEVLIAFSMLAFFLAIIGGLFAPAFLDFISAEGFSRACSNLALIAIAIQFCIRDNLGTL